MTRMTRPVQPEKPTTFSVNPEFENVITRYGHSTYRFFIEQDIDVLNTLGVTVIEGEFPGSTYFEAELRIPIDEANARAKAAGIPIRFKLKGTRAGKRQAPEAARGSVLPERQAGPEERLFGGKGIVIPFRFNIPDKDEPAADD